MTDVIVTKDEAIAANQDPFGRVWQAAPAPGTNLYRLEVLNDDGTTVVPRNYPADLRGLFTNRQRCNSVLQPWLHQQWLQAELAAQKQARKEYKEKNA